MPHRRACCACAGDVLPVSQQRCGLLAALLWFIVQFKIQFEVNLIVQFCDGYQITENFPIQIYR